MFFEAGFFLQSLFEVFELYARAFFDCRSWEGFMIFFPRKVVSLSYLSNSETAEKIGNSGHNPIF